MALIFVLLFIFTIATIIGLLSYVSRRKFKLPPGPWGLPIIGYLPWLPIRFAKQQDAFSKLRRTYGNIMSVRVGNTVAIVISDFALIQQAFSNPSLMARHNKYPTDVIPSGNFGMAKSNGEKWKNHRRFFLRKLHDLGIGTTTFDKVVKEQVDVWIVKLRQCARNNEPYEVSNCLNILLLNTLWELFCSEKFDSEDKSTHKMLEDFALMIDVMTSSYMFASLPKWLQKILKLVFRKRISCYEKKWTDLFTFFENFVRNLSTRENMKTSGKDFLVDYFKEMANWKLNNSKEGTEAMFTEYDLVLLIMEIFIAANDSSSSAIKWAIVSFARDQKTQEAVQKELDEVVGKGNELSLNHRKQLHLLSAALSESLRSLGSPLLSLEHVAIDDTRIGSYDVPKGTHVFCDIKSIHSDPALWNSAEEFNTKNFLDEDGNYFHPKSGYMPFSFGKRSCAGEALAKHHLFFFVASLLQKFKFRIPDGERIVLTPVGAANTPMPFKILVEERI